MDVKELILDLSLIEGALWVVGGGGIVSENFPTGLATPRFEDDYLNIESDNWHIHLTLDQVNGVQFVEAEDHIAPFLYYVRFSNMAGDTLLRFYFPNPYLDDSSKLTDFQPQRLIVFEKYKDEYVGRDGIVYVKRKRSSSQ